MDAPKETKLEIRARLLSGEWHPFTPPDGHPEVVKIVSRLPKPDGRRCTNFLTIKEVCEMMNAR